MSLWDNLLASIAVEKEYGIEDPQEAATSLLAYLQDDTSPSAYNPQHNEVIQEAQDIATSMQRVLALRKYAPTKRITSPTYKKYAPAGSPWKQHSAPLPLEYKADVNTRKGIVTAYLTTYLGADGQPFVDPYNDIIHDTAFHATLADLEKQRKRKGDNWLVPDLWQHQRHEIIGGIKGITLDKRGPIYEAHLFMGVQRARECLEICERKACGSSFGYDPVDYEHDQKGIRHLKAVRLHEVSQVTFAANSEAPILNVKSQFYVSSNYHVKTNPFAALDTWAATVRE